MKNNLNLPFNLLVGSEAFFSTDMAGAGNSSGWALINKSQAYKNCYGTYESIADKGWEARAI